MSNTAIALHRFGLGARPDEPPPADPRGWLLGQLTANPGLPAPWQGQPRTASLVATGLAKQRAIRLAPEDQRADLRAAALREARSTYLGAVAARGDSALQAASPFVERLVHFWANHFAVSVDKPTVLPLAGAFEADAIRPLVLGRFEDLLLAAVRHPAMLLYLDQAPSMGPNSPAGLRIAARAQRQRGLNENLAREILELHTLGVRSGYTQDDVTELARALTGWTLPVDDQATAEAAGASEGMAFRFAPLLHEPGARTVLGRRHAEAGEAQGRAILAGLAAAPATARHIATKLARHLVADDPPAALVQRLADAFLRSGGDLPTVYRALIDAPEAWQATGTKFKTPWDWSLSALRALGRTTLPAAQWTGLLNPLGQPVWRPGSPAGFDDTAAGWAAPDALVRRVEAAQRLAAQAGPGQDARQLAPQVLPGVLDEATAAAIARAESGTTALALLLASPAFLRR